MNNLANISNVKQILSKYGFVFSKSLGQNFLINSTICNDIANQCGVDLNTGVLEIGPGIGALTYELAKRAKKVVTVELDKRLIPILDQTLCVFDNIKVINEDILNIAIDKVIEAEFSDLNVSVCANLPYYITSPIIIKLLKCKLPINSITLMLQKEAANRICISPGKRGSNLTSTIVNYYSKPEILFNVSRGNFIPMPNVDSCVIKLNILSEPSIKTENEDLFFKIIKSGFSQKRKTLANCLSNSFGVDKREIINLFYKAGIKSNVRAEELTLEEFNKLERLFEKVL